VAGNASIAVVTSWGEVLVSVFLENIEPETVSTVLSSFNTVDKAVSLIIKGDFETLSVNEADRNYFCDQGEDVMDCVPEVFEDFKDYERAFSGSGHTYNYVLYNGVWYILSEKDKKPVYTPLKLTKKGRDVRDYRKKRKKDKHQLSQGRV
jgi:hypothetical protein